LSFSIDFAVKRRILDEPTADAHRHRVLILGRPDFIGVFFHV